jgi:hypothetical protein
MSPTEFQKWLYGNFPPGVKSWSFGGGGTILLEFENGQALHLTMRAVESSEGLGS